MDLDIFVASKLGDIKTVKAFLDKGVDPNTKDSRGFPAISYAVKFSRTNIVKLLLDHGAYPQSSLLTSAIMSTFDVWADNRKTGDTMNTIRILMDYGVDVNKDDRLLKTIITSINFHTYFEFYKKVMEYLIQGGATISPEVLKEAESEDEIEIDLRRGTQRILPFFLKELDRRQQEMVNSWANLRSMNEINIYEENEYGDTPLIVAANRGDLQTVKLLLDMGSDINHRNIKGQTALHNAAYNKHNAIVNLLLEEGADGNFKDDTGMTYKDLIYKIEKPL